VNMVQAAAARASRKKMLGAVRAHLG
jgi:hypothetical protein